MTSADIIYMLENTDHLRMIGNLDADDQTALLAWCRTHDWGIGAKLCRHNHYANRTDTAIVLADGTSFIDPEQLLHWAGY